MIGSMKLMTRKAKLLLREPAVTLFAREPDAADRRRGRVGVLRRDTLENWLAHDPVLADREVVWCSDVPWLKVGDGESRFSELPWWMPEGSGGV